ncbi:MAG: GatB/YqeY domain-containing protein [Desulfobacterales bacterium]|nr:GatB/YqeY domain-containing protein [Desulfobacterales bacterium]MCP4160139.1 GatB/YqeY domain-containing protein [Deltaproteobacteria bacterium]
MISNYEEYGWNSSLSISLKDKLKEDMKNSMRSKQNDVRDAIRIVIGEYPKLTVPITLESGKKTTKVKTFEDITDEDVTELIRNLHKSEKTVLEIKNEKESDYLLILSRYLPVMKTKEEISAWIDENINFDELNNPMQAMKEIMKHFGKLADGNIVKDLLNKR